MSKRVLIVTNDPSLIKIVKPGARVTGLKIGKQRPDMVLVIDDDPPDDRHREVFERAKLEAWYEQQVRPLLANNPSDVVWLDDN